MAKLICGEIKPDSGTISLQKGSSIAGLSQELPAGLTGSVYDVVATGLGEIGVLLEEFRHLTDRLVRGADNSVLKRMDALQLIFTLTVPEISVQTSSISGCVKTGL